MPEKKTKNDYIPHDGPGQACGFAGCGEAGQYKAPAGKERLHEYQWFCLDHIREYNKQWDFFKGMNAYEIEDFIRDATTGHRPTWSRESQVRRQYERLQEALHDFWHMGAKKAARAHPPLSRQIKDALAVMEMNYPYTLRGLKRQYRLLVKKHHPDVNAGDRLAEEKFKTITAAYARLTQHGENV